MSKLLLCVLLVLQALLAGYQQLAVAASAHQIGDDFLCQDPVRGPSGIMLSHARSDDELNGDGACPGDWTREREGAVMDGAEAFFSGDEYTGEDDEDETLFVPRDPGRCADEEEIADGEESPMLGGRGHDAVAEASKDSEELGSSSGGDVECPECGKVFRSDKSMFGHLRSHPDRGYKGATPPRAKPRLLPVPSRPSPSPVEDRPVAVARYSQRDPNLNAFEMLAGYIMLTLKHRDSRIARERERERSVNVKREPDVSPEAEDEGSAVSKTGGDGVALRDRHGSSGSVTTIEEDNPSEHGGSTAELTAAAAEPVRRPSEHGCTTVAVEAPTKSKRERTNKSKEAREARRKEKDVASAGKGRGPYICKHCQAVFPTHQALGGHMAAHNKDRRVQAQNEQTALDLELEAHHQNRQGGDEEVGRRGGMSASTRALLMERYTRMFNQGWQTRQETGGYRRQHTESEDGSTLPQVAPPVADRDRCRLFGINLNVQAPHQE